MTTRQAVWPPDLIARRGDAHRLDERIRDLSRRPTLDLEAEIAHLHAARAALPCPHWNVTPVLFVTDEWECDDCHDRIVPAWVPLADQEAHLRRAGTWRLSA